MCGIAGIVTDVHHDVVEAMVRSLIHRGPDVDGFYKDDHIAIGQRRLSIIDIEGGRQPISNETETRGGFLCTSRFRRRIPAVSCIKIC